MVSINVIVWAQLLDRSFNDSNLRCPKAVDSFDPIQEPNGLNNWAKLGKKRNFLVFAFPLGSGNRIVIKLKEK